ncbi:hypothetical protein [Faecalibacillus faecis]|uniref:hypothetical protein n=1 Tax=Faecalibacillus faecis TaxID=1982628 RepID=UPI00386D7F9D
MLINKKILTKICQTDDIYYSTFNHNFVAKLTPDIVEDTDKHIRIIQRLEKLGTSSIEEFFDQTTGLVNLVFAF